MKAVTANSDDGAVEAGRPLVLLIDADDRHGLSCPLVFVVWIPGDVRGRDERPQLIVTPSGARDVSNLFGPTAQRRIHPVRS